jgi:hypothetical protein
MLPVNFRFGGHYLLESETGGLKTNKVGLLVHAVIQLYGEEQARTSGGCAKRGSGAYSSHIGNS